MSTDFQYLNDDMVKLVAYAIVSVRRGHERILDGGEGTLLVIGKMTAESFTSFIIGRYLQQEVSKDDKEEAIKELIKALDRYLCKGAGGDARNFAELVRTDLQETLTDKQANDTKPKQLRRIPDEDRRFLRVHFVVSNRWSREAEKFEEEQIAVLEEIRQAIP